MPAKENLVGKKFNKLLVIQEVPKEERTNIKKVEWLCKCDCGNITKVITNYLKNGHTKSCGCQRAAAASLNFSSDLINQKFGKLLVIEKTDNRGSDGSIVWRCKCDCGNYHYASTNSLKTGAIASCGCVRSKGEQKINNLLFENGINYQTQYWFNDLKDKKYLYFDFAIFNNDGSLKCLVEYQGIQHFDPSALHGSWKNLPQIHDEMKKNYCQKKGIALIEIPYTDFDIIDWKYLENKLGLL